MSEEKFGIWDTSNDGWLLDEEAYDDVKIIFATEAEAEKFAQEQNDADGEDFYEARSIQFLLDFEETASQINRKLKEAATALKEANRLATEAKLEGLIDSMWLRDDMTGNDYEEFQQKIDLIDVSELEGELESAGWSTSSSYC
jgi:hypothetical protein